MPRFINRSTTIQLVIDGYGSVWVSASTENDHNQVIQFNVGAVNNAEANVIASIRSVLANINSEESNNA